MFEYRTGVRYSAIFSEDCWSVNGYPRGNIHPSASQDRRKSRVAFAVAGQPDKEYLATLAKGLAVRPDLRSRRAPRVSLSQAAAGGRPFARRRPVGCSSRWPARLCRRKRAGTFRLAARARPWLFLSAGARWVDRAEPFLKALSGTSRRLSTSVLHAIGEWLSLESNAAHHVRAMSAGRVFPAFHSALGRVQLGVLSDEEHVARPTTRIVPYTSSTIVDLQRVGGASKGRSRSAASRSSMRNLRTVSRVRVPFDSLGGRPVGAINVTSHAARTTRNELRELFCPRLGDVARHSRFHSLRV